ncbi:unnamed protein product [Heterobilharzia americana]|nr:unnamed protein product [Heterobilharzia americana]
MITMDISSMYWEGGRNHRELPAMGKVSAKSNARDNAGVLKWMLLVRMYEEQIKSKSREEQKRNEAHLQMTGLVQGVPYVMTTVPGHNDEHSIPRGLSSMIILTATSIEETEDQT